MSDKVISVQSPRYAPSVGSLSPIKKVNGENSGHEIDKWFTCREEFHRNADIKDGFLFYFHNKEDDNIRKFMVVVEEKLKIPKGLGVIFNKTTASNIMYVHPNTWWGKQQMRFSLLTILLRCGRQYT